MPLTAPTDLAQLLDYAILAWAITATAIALGALGTARDWRRAYHRAKARADRAEARHHTPYIIEVSTPLDSGQMARLAHRWRQRGYPAPITTEATDP